MSAKATVRLKITGSLFSFPRGTIYETFGNVMFVGDGRAVRYGTHGSVTIAATALLDGCGANIGPDQLWRVHSIPKVSISGAFDLVTIENPEPASGGED